MTVHPHTRGEHTDASNFAARSCGSSPHAWGTLPGQVKRGGQDRFIPTRVGNTGPTAVCSMATPVHPHTRGEHAFARRIRPQKFGSSPHAWGTRTSGRYGSRPFRFIPTRVGNTRLSTTASAVCSVHPHTRGEHEPLANAGFRVCRFIPTRVGNTGCNRPDGRTRSVHPHTRGEHSTTYYAT